MRNQSYIYTIFARSQLLMRRNIFEYFFATFALLDLKRERETERYLFAYVLIIIRGLWA